MAIMASRCGIRKQELVCHLWNSLDLQAYIIPLVALTFGLARCGQCRTRLYSLYPMMNGLTLALTITLVAPALDSISKFLFSSSSLCEKFDNAVGEPCLVS